METDGNHFIHVMSVPIGRKKKKKKTEYSVLIEKVGLCSKTSYVTEPLWFLRRQIVKITCFCLFDSKRNEKRKSKFENGH